MRMQRVRKSVLDTRGYLDGLLDVFVSVRQVHKHDIDQVYNHSHWWQKTTPEQKTDTEKTILVLVSPTQRLSGEVGRHVYREFTQAVKEKSPDTKLAIVGRIGRDLFVSEFGDKQPFLYFEWQENNAEQADLPSFLAQLTQFKKVIVFSSEFQSLVTQEPKQRTLTGNEELQQDRQTPQTTQMYLCEPTIEEIVTFFEQQVVASLFKQSLQEAHLAHLGSRVTALEQATQTITKEKRKLNQTLQQLLRQQQQQKQRQRMAGMSLWLT